MYLDPVYCMSLCVLSFKQLFPVFVYVSKDFSLFTLNIHLFSSSYRFIIQRKWKFFCDMVGCCQGTISRSASPSQSRKNVVKSVDLFEFYPFSYELFFGLLVCVCGKQYEIGTEKNSVTDAGYAWRTRKEVIWNESLRQCVIGCSNTMCFLTPCSLSTLLTFSHFSRPICFPDIVLTWLDPTMTFVFLHMVAAFLLSSSFYLYSVC